jgi:acetoin utilization deacetylase AcuC-like enzyme
MEKYGKLRDLVAQLEGIQLVNAPAVTDTQILYAHDASYLFKVLQGALSRQEQQEIGFPRSPQLVERSRRSAGATLAAANIAIKEAVATNLAGVHTTPIAIKGVGSVCLMIRQSRYERFKEK